MGTFYFADYMRRRGVQMVDLRPQVGELHALSPVLACASRTIYTGKYIGQAHLPMVKPNQITDMVWLHKVVHGNQ